jgi:hypothetical protein
MINYTFHFGDIASIQFEKELQNVQGAIMVVIVW